MSIPLRRTLSATAPKIQTPGLFPIKPSHLFPAALPSRLCGQSLPEIRMLPSEAPRDPGDGNQVGMIPLNGTISVMPLDQIDPLHFSTVRLEALYNEQPLGVATGFFFYGLLDAKPNYWLVTNWHVLSGRNNQTLDCSHPSGGIPNRLKMGVFLKHLPPGVKDHPGGDLLMQSQTIELYDSAGAAGWYQHQTGKNAIDVAVVNVGALAHWHIRGVNEIATQHDMAIEIGNDVFILGYPLGFSHFINTPIWKKGSIASEPHLETNTTTDRIIIDATTRSGMSGSPVIMRAKTHYISEKGEVVAHRNATRLIGVYSSRPLLGPPGSNPEEKFAEIGYVYKSGAIDAVIQNGIRGPAFGEKP